MKTHTPGPWKIGELAFEGSTHVCIAQAEAIDRGGVSESVCLISGVSTFTSQDAANAHLISAAPELLECLYEVWNTTVLGGLSPEMNDKIVAALKKAKGVTT